MLGKTFGVLVLVSLVFGTLSGNLPALGGAVFDGAAAAIPLALSLGGVMCLWNGILAMLEKAGLIRRFARLIRPFLRLLFPDSAEPERGGEELAATLAANLLGMGNATTPLALSALEKMERFNPTPGIPTRDEITLTVMNTAPLCLLPTTILSLLRTAGAAEPYRVLIPIWISSAATCTFAVVLSRLCGAAVRK